MRDAYRTITPRTHIHYPSLITRAQLAKAAGMPRKSIKNHLLCVGRLSPEKGHRYLLTAMAELRGNGLACTLDIVGSGPTEQELHSQAIMLGLSDSVKFQGYVPFGPALFQFYQNATAVIIPSLSEGLPQVIAEALMTGVPTVATRVGGIPNFLMDDKDSILVPPGSSHALAEALARLLRSPDQQSRLAKAGQLLMRDFTLEAERDKMAQIIRSEVLGGSELNK